MGATDLLVSELGFGAFAIGGNRSGNSYGPTDDRTSAVAVRAALDLGCTFFDTADVYGHGHSEAVLGGALKVAGRLDDVVIATKVGGNFDDGRTRMDFSPRHLLSAVQASLRRLGRDHIDLYQLHDPPLHVIEDGEAFGVLDDLVERGLIRHYGASIHSLEEGRACLRYENLRTLQVPYNLFFLALSPDFPAGLFAECARRGVGLIAREPLAAGFLSGRHAPGTTYGEGDLRGRWPAGRRRVYVALADSVRRLERPGVTLAQAALRFVLDELAFATTIVGVKTPAQAVENFAVPDLPAFAQIEQTAVR
ncbi:aldo/keto reductase [Sphaerisporangium sp. NPDC004334]